MSTSRLIPAGFVGTLLIGSLAAFFLYSDVRYVSRARSVRAMVTGFWLGYRTSPNIAEVEFVAGQQAILANLDLGRGRIEVGQTVEILHSPDDPHDVILDRFWNKYYRSILSVVVFEVIALAEASACVERLRARDRFIRRPDISRIYDDAARDRVDEAVASARQARQI